jgi:hypothetical protein
MGVLDQLRYEVSSKQENEASVASVQQQLEREYQATILPKMQKTFLFLKEIVEHLNYLEKAVEIEDYSRDYPQIGNLTQTNYKINTDGYGGFADFNRITQINVTFICQGSGEFTYSLEGKVRIEQEVSFLHARNVPFTWNQYVCSKGIDAATFTITRKIPVRFKFEVDYDNSKIKLLINNHENFNVYSKTFAPEAINELLLDEVIRFMLRQDSDFIRLDITSQDKQRIQKKAEEEQLQRAKWLEEIKIEETKNVKKESDNGESVFFNRIKSFTGLRHRTSKE